MSASVARKILTQVCGSNLKNVYTRTIIVRFCSKTSNKSLNLEDQTKNVIPASEPGKISAAVLRKFNDRLAFQNLDPPKILQPNEVLVDVDYCAINESDVLLLQNMQTFVPTLPLVLGYELVGKLAQVGGEAEKQGYKIGDKVIALNKDRYGGLAEKCTAEISDIWKVPSGMKSVEAVCLLDDYITALLAIESKVSIQEEDMIVINVGISNIGLAAIDLATNVFKAQVISVCATEDAAAIAREKGVLASFKYKTGKVLKQIQDIAADKDINVVFNDADGEYLKKVLNCFTSIYKTDASIKDLLRDDSFAVMVHHLSREGRVIIAGTVGMASDNSDEAKDSCTISGFNLKDYRKKKPESYREAGDDILQFAEDGLIKPTCALTVGLSEVNDAIQFLLKRKSPGKVIVDIKDR